MRRLLVLSILLHSLQGYAQSGTLDPSFGIDGFVALPFFGSTFQSDGKMVGIRTVNKNFVVNRYNIDGTPDASFGSGGTVTTDLGSPLLPSPDYAISVAIQNDGKIVVLGHTDSRSSPGSSPERTVRLVRYNSNGTLDASFGNGGIVQNYFGNTHNSDQLNKVAIGKDGKIYVTSRYRGPGEGHIKIRVYSTTGTFITVVSMNQPGYYGSEPTALLIQSDGKIVVGGYTFRNLDRDQVNDYLILARYNSDLTPDASFGTNGTIIRTANNRVNTLNSQDDGKLVVAADNELLRFNANGTLDPSFKSGGIVIPPFGISSILIQSDKKIIAGGNLDGDFTFARYNSNGTLDASFGTNGITTNDFGGTESIQSMTIAGNRLYTYGSGILARTGSGVTSNATIVRKGFDEEEAVVIDKLTVQTLPNPTSHHFTLIAQSKDAGPLQIKVLNALGGVVEVRSKVASNSAIRIGDSYRPGLYVVEVVQGKEKVVTKLVKVTK